MKLFLSQVSENGLLGGSKEKQFAFLHKDIYYEITIEQFVKRQITISSPKTNTTKDLLDVFYTLSTLLMLFDGQFYSVDRAVENDTEITHSFQQRTLPSYNSADFMIGSGNSLIDYESVLSAALFSRWTALQEELDIIHNMVLYCVSAVQMPVDMKCAFMIEAFLGISELLNGRKMGFSLPDVQKGESKLKKYLIAIMERYGDAIFREECEKNKEHFAQILVDSRNRIAHIKSKQGRCYLNGEESVIYISKLSLLYRVVLFDLLEISEESYSEKLQRRVDALNQHLGILNGFLEKIEHK